MQKQQVNENTVQFSNSSKTVTCVYDAHGCEDYDFAVFLGASMQTLWGTVRDEAGELLLQVTGCNTVWRYSNDDAGWLLLAQEAG